MATADVLVIGAGIAGLACAYELKRAGLRTVVLEGRDRVGGRIWTLRLPGEPPIELGAQVVHGDRAATWNIIRERQLRVKALQHLDNFRFVIGDSALQVPDLVRQGVVPPWAAEGLVLRRELPDRPVGEVLRALGMQGLGLQLGTEWVEQTWCADSSDLSAAGMRRVKSAETNGSGEFVLLDGYDRVPKALAEELDVRLNCPVECVRWEVGEAEVLVAGESWQARAVVVTVPPAVIADGGLRFEPGLPHWKLAAAQARRAGDALVMLAELAAPAPRSEWAMVAGEVGGLWRAEAGSPIVRSWSKGPTAQRIRAADPMRVVFDAVRRAFPWAQPVANGRVWVADWGADAYSRGGYSYPRVAALEQGRAWAQTLGDTIFFAGEATCADRHMGLVHGALESGTHAAGEIFRALG